MIFDERQETAAAGEARAPAPEAGPIGAFAQRALHGVASGCIILALALGPLAFAGVEPWAYALLAALAYSALAAALAYAVLTKTLRRLAAPLLIPLALALVLVLLQYASWPEALLERVSPATVRMQRLASDTDGAPLAVRPSPSLYPYATRGAFVCLSAYAALFVAALACARTRRDIARFALAIIIVGFVVSFLGILQSLAGVRKLYGLVELRHGGDPFGPFVNRNEFAAYAGLCFFVGIGLLLARATRIARTFRGWRDDLLSEASRRLPRTLLLIFAVAVTGAALLWSLSRGGIMAMLLAAGGFFGCLALMRVQRARIWYGAAILLLVVGGVAWLGAAPVEERLATVGDTTQLSAAWRLKMFGDAWRMGLQFPALGTGAGTFYSVYPYFRTLPTDKLSPSPHNEYLHVLAETGFTGLALLLAAMAVFFISMVRALRARRSLYARCFVAGCVCAVLMVATHSLVDFPMRAPAVACTVAVVAALAYAASEREEAGEGFSAAAPARPATDSKAPPEALGQEEGLALWKLVFFAAVAAAWYAACGAALGLMHDQLQERFVKRNARLLSAQTCNAPEFAQSCQEWIGRHAAGDAELCGAVADFSRSAALLGADQSDRLALIDTAVDVRMAAARCEPVNAFHHAGLAMDYMTFGRRDLAWFEAEQACRLQPNNAWMPARLAEFFASQHDLSLAKSCLAKAQAAVAAWGTRASEPERSEMEALLSDAGERVEKAARPE